MRSKVIMTAFVSQPCLPSVPGDKQSLRLRHHQGIPGIEVTPSGRLFAVWYANDIAGEGPGNYAVLAVSDDHGLSWREIQTVAPDAADIRVFDPVLWFDPRGRLWWCWSQSFSSGIGDVYDGRAGVWAVYCEDTEATLPQWSTPRRIADGVMMNKPTVVSDGSWVFPTAMWSCYPEKTPEELRSLNRSNFSVTRDEGKTFSLLPGPDVPQRSFDEHMLIERRNGAWWTLVRTKYGIGQSISNDHGRTWSPGVDSGLCGPDSRFAIRRLRSGRLLLVNNQPVAVALPGETLLDKPRVNLSAWLSDDDGASWYGRLLMDGRCEVSYPDLTESPDGFIYVIYDHKRTELGQIVLSRFTEADVSAGNMVSSGSFAGMLVSAFEH